MKVYLASQFAKQNELCSYREDLLRIGWHVTSNWLDEIEDPSADPFIYAQNDLLDIDNADAVIVFPGPPYLGGTEGAARGGHHFEAGWAYAKGKLIIVIGKTDNGFYHMPDMQHFQSWEGFYRSLHV